LKIKNVTVQWFDLFQLFLIIIIVVVVAGFQWS